MKEEAASSACDAAEYWPCACEGREAAHQGQQAKQAQQAPAERPKAAAGVSKKKDPSPLRPSQKWCYRCCCRRQEEEEASSEA